ncbi:DUF805 domain-containing protein, partial [Rubrivirga sp.]|uniref:DUF805 domain-containing protein n=1 Tax=Rubrivirga sp. TaxID=1885344 RepID=UPI003C7898B7
MSTYLSVLLDHYADVEGRASRREYWTFTLIHSVVLVGLWFVTIFASSGNLTELFPFASLALAAYSLGTIVPGFAIAIRRLHDTNKSWMMLLFGLVPFVGALIVFLLMILDGDRGPNSYGDDPEGRDAVGLSPPPVRTTRSFSFSVGTADHSVTFGT